MSRTIITVLLAAITLHPEAWADLKAPEFQVRTTVHAGKVDLKATPPAGHHINLQAPMQFALDGAEQKIKPKHADSREALFELSSPASHSGKITLFICDDANTFCEKHQKTVSWAGSSHPSEAPVPQKPTPALEEGTKSASLKKPVDAHGFIDNRPEEAFQLAKSKGLPLLIDFYGIWCPPCNELNDKVFSTPDFKKETARFVKLKVDVDAAANEGLLTRYRIAGYPTILFASPEGDEISRILGFRPKGEFFAQTRKAWAARKQPFAALKAKADAGNSVAADKVGLIHYARQEYEQAIHYLKRTKKHREALLASRAAMDELRAKEGDSTAKLAWMQALEKTITEFPDSPDSIGRRSSLAELLDARKRADDARKVRQELIASAKKLIQKPELLQGYDNTVGDLWISIAEAQETLGKKDEAKKAWNLAATEFRKKIEAGAERGGSLELAYCLRQLGENDEAEKLYTRMETAYPTEATFYLSHARMNLSLKRFDKARDLAKKAFENSYGMNRLSSALALAQVYHQMKEPKLAKKVIREAIDSAPPVPPSKEKSGWKLRIEALKKLDREISSSASA